MVVQEMLETLRDGRVDNVSVYALDRGRRFFAECCLTFGVTHEVELWRLRADLYYSWCLKTGKCRGRLRSPDVARIWEDP